MRVGGTNSPWKHRTQQRLVKCALPPCFTCGHLGCVSLEEGCSGAALFPQLRSPAVSLAFSAPVQAGAILNAMIPGGKAMLSRFALIRGKGASFQKGWIARYFGRFGKGVLYVQNDYLGTYATLGAIHPSLPGSSQFISPWLRKRRTLSMQKRVRQWERANRPEIICPGE